MTAENKTWQTVKAEYLRQVEKALSSVEHPRRNEVLEDVTAHLDGRFAELAPDQQTWESFQEIITEMGPASDYAELLGPAAATPSATLRKYLFLFGLVVILIISAVVLLPRFLSPKVGYIITFRPVEPFAPQTASQLLAAFNQNHPRGVRTHHFRTRTRDDKLEGLICVDNNFAKGAIVSMIDKSEKLKPIGVRQVTKRQLEKHCRLGQPSLSSVPIYIVSFKPVAPFAPQTARDLLNAFNENHPRGVRTHHFRTQVQDNILLGHICVDTQAGKDAVVSMLRTNTKLQLLKAERATDEDLEKLYKMRQPSLTKGTRKPDTDKRPSSRRTNVPRAYGETITQTGSWPVGNCAVVGRVFRNAGCSRVDYAKVCLSSAEFGSWIVAARDSSFQFTDIPAGTYTLKTTDTPGYKDTYYNPQDQPGENPTFQLKENEPRHYVKLLVEPIRPYRKISGRVLNEYGYPITGNKDLIVSAWLTKEQDPKKRNYCWNSIAQINSQDGSYLLDGLDGRPVYVTIMESGRPNYKDNPYPPRFYPGTFSRNDATLITFGENQLIENVDINMARSGGLVLEGKVTDESTRQPVPEALVSIFHYDMFFDLFPAYTDENGRYTIKGLGEGKFIVHVDARHRGFVKTRRYVTIEPCAKQTLLDLTLRPGATISGSLVDDQGNDWQIDRGDGFSSTDIPRRRGEGASNFPYANKYAPSYIKEQPTIFYEEGEGDNIASRMVFPTKSSFLLPAVLPGKVKIEFYPRTKGHKLSRILYQGRDISETGLDAAPGQQIKDVKIVIAPR